MTEPVSCGTLPPEISSILWKGIKMLCIVWRSMFRLVIKYALVLLITLRKYGAQSQVNKFRLSLDIQVKSLQYHLTLMAFLSVQALWIAQLRFGTLKWVRFIQH